jgi:hypothetical protein
MAARMASAVERATLRPRQRAFVSRTSNVHVRNGAGVIAMGEPGTAEGPSRRTPATDAASMIAGDSPRRRLR